MASPKNKVPPRGPVGNWRPALKSVPSLQLPHKILVDCLTNGHGYDSESTGALVKEGNRLFEARQLQKAAEVYGAAYEIGRLHYVYPPLMHDLILRRVLCLSMLGDLKRAQFEVEMALKIVPHAPTTVLICAILYSKQRRSDDANIAYHHSVEQCALLRDLVESIVALFAQARGHCDHAIEICTKVLQRTPSYPAALYVRYMAYKFHPSGHYDKQGATDLSELLEVDLNVAPFVTERFTLENHSRMEELLLHFHPWLAAEGPRPYEDYPVYSQRQPFLSVSLVAFGAAKLKTLVRSARLVRSVYEKHKELLEQRAAAEKKMQQLVDAQQSYAHLDQHTEVWGPTDPDHAVCRRYRRYWMERPANFPQRDNGPFSQPLTIEKTAAVAGQGQAGQSFRSLPAAIQQHPSFDHGHWPPGPDTLNHSIGPQLTHAESSSTWPRTAGNMTGPAAASSAPAPQRPTGPAAADSAVVRPEQTQRYPQNANNSTSSVSLERTNLPAASSANAMGNVSDRSPSQTAALQAGVPVVPKAPPLPLVENGGMQSFQAAAPPTAAPPAPFPPPAQSAGRTTTSVRSTPTATARPTPTPLSSGAMPSLQPVLDSTYEGQGPPWIRPPPSKIGAEWTQRQWFLKALELSDAFSTGCDLPGLDMNPTCSSPKLPNHRNSQAGPAWEQAPPPACRIVRIVNDKKESLIEAVEREGFEAIPDWYGALDRIYAITDMARVSEKPEPFVGEANRAGAPGYSYLIAKNPASQTSSVISPAEEEARARAHEALMQRYQNRLLVTSLPYKGEARATKGTS